MNTKATKTNDSRREMILTSPIEKIIPRMAIPTVISMLTMAFYNMADTYFVSSLGIEATGAVGVNASLMSFIQMAGSTVAVGAGSFISRLLGEKRDEEGSQVMSVAFFASLFIGFLVAVFGLIFIDKLVWLLGARDPKVIKYSIDYASYILYSAPFMAASFVLSQTLRSEGRAALSMVGMVAGTVLNLGLDPLFIFVFGWEVAGAAAATAISKFVGFCILMYPYIKRQTMLSISLRKCKVNKLIVTEISKMGFPTLFRTGLTTIAGVIMNSVASGFSAAALAGISVVNRIMMFITSAVVGFGQGHQPVCGFNWGAKRYDRIVGAMRFSSKVAVIGSVIIGGLVFVFAPQLMGVFSDNAEAIRIGVFSIRTQCAVIPLQAYLIVINMTYAGLGKATGAALLSLSRQGIFFIPVVAILPVVFGVMGLAAAQGVADLLSLSIGIPLAVKLTKELNKLMAENGQSVKPAKSKV